MRPVAAVAVEERIELALDRVALSMMVPFLELRRLLLGASFIGFLITVSAQLTCGCSTSEVCTNPIFERLLPDLIESDFRTRL